MKPGPSALAAIIGSILLLFCTPRVAASDTVEKGVMNSVTYFYRVFLWTPDGAVVPISPDEGFYTHASIHPAGGSAVFWGGVSGLPRIWFREFDADSMVPLTPPDMAAMTPSFNPVSAPTHLMSYCFAGLRRVNLKRRSTGANRKGRSSIT